VSRQRLTRYPGSRPSPAARKTVRLASCPIASSRLPSRRHPRN
jgi:hypothetical protein